MGCLGKPAITSLSLPLGPSAWIKPVGFRRLFIIIAKQESSISEKLKVTILYSKDYDGTGLCEASLAPLYIG